MEKLCRGVQNCMACVIKGAGTPHFQLHMERVGTCTPFRGFRCNDGTTNKNHAPNPTHAQHLNLGGLACNGLYPRPCATGPAGSTGTSPENQHGLRKRALHRLIPILVKGPNLRFYVSFCRCCKLKGSSCRVRGQTPAHPAT